MAMFAFMMTIAFPHGDYIKREFDGRDQMSLASNISHAMSVKDVAADTVHQFTTKYNSYTLYHDGGQKVEGKKMQNVLKASLAKDRMEYIEEEEEEPQGLLAHDGMAQARRGRGSRACASVDRFLPPIVGLTPPRAQPASPRPQAHGEDEEAGAERSGPANGAAGPSGKGKQPSPKQPEVGPLAGLDDSDEDSDAALEGPEALDVEDHGPGHAHGKAADTGPKQDEDGHFSYEAGAAKLTTEDGDAIKSKDEEEEDRMMAVHL